MAGSLRRAPDPLGSRKRATDRYGIKFYGFLLLIVSFSYQLPIMATVPSVKANWVDNPPGTPGPTSILQMLTDTLVWDDDERCSMAISRSTDGRPVYTDLQVSPNPANTFIRLELPGKEDLLWHLSLVNINGVTAATWSLTSGAHQLVLPFLPEGLYSLAGRNAQGEIHSARLVINR